MVYVWSTGPQKLHRMDDMWKEVGTVWNYVTRHSQRPYKVRGGNRRWRPKADTAIAVSYTYSSFIPYHTIPYHTILYHTIPYHTIPYSSFTPYHTIPYSYSSFWPCGPMGRWLKLCWTRKVDLNNLCQKDRLPLSKAKMMTENCKWPNKMQTR